MTPGGLQLYSGHSICGTTIKNLKYELALGVISSSSFLSKQIRATWSLKFFIQMRSLQERIADRILASATMPTLRECLLKIAVVLRESTRRIVDNFTAQHTLVDIWIKFAMNMRSAS